jgi:glycosyltransferase involved in cell wall biosynthesis
MSPPRVSLLIPCRNAAGYLPRLFEGVRTQTRPFDEIICYDDRSTDDTASVAQSLGARVLPADGPSTGPARARNRLAAAATGDWIHFHDADDLIDPGYLSAMLTAATREADVVFCDADWIGEEKRELWMEWRYAAAPLGADPVSYLIRQPVGINNGLFRRDRFLSIGGFDETLLMWEDNDVYVRLAAAGAHCVHVPGVFTWSLRHTDSFSHNYRKNWRCRVQALEKYAATLPTSARAAIAEEAEKAAQNLVALADLEGTRPALGLCRRLGHPVPTTRHPALRFLRLVLPSLWLLRLQHHRRNCA